MYNGGPGITVFGSGYPTGGEGFSEIGGVSVEVIGMTINVPPLGGLEIMDRAFGVMVWQL